MLTAWGVEGIGFVFYIEFGLGVPEGQEFKASHVQLRNSLAKPGYRLSSLSHPATGRASPSHARVQSYVDMHWFVGTTMWCSFT